MVDNFYLRVSRCEAICNQLRSEMNDVLQDAYHKAIEDHDEEIAARSCRQIRNHLLEDTDKYMLADRPYLEEWAQYREALRELPEQEGFPFDVEFPDKPEG